MRKKRSLRKKRSTEEEEVAEEEDEIMPPPIVQADASIDSDSFKIVGASTAIKRRRRKRRKRSILPMLAAIGVFSFVLATFGYWWMQSSKVPLTEMLADILGTTVRPASNDPETQPPAISKSSETATLFKTPERATQLGELLNQAGVACEAFDWIPIDIDQYQHLQKFSRRFSTADKLIHDNQASVSDSVSLSTLSDEIKRCQRLVSDSISDSFKQTSEKVSNLNSIAIDKLNAQRPNTANTYVPFVAEFYSKGFDEIDEETILLTLNEDQALIKVPFSGSIRELRPGSLWLCFYQRSSQPSNNFVKLNSGQSVPLYKDGDILFVFGPIKKR